MANEIPPPTPPPPDTTIEQLEKTIADLHAQVTALMNMASTNKTVLVTLRAKIAAAQKDLA